MGTFIYASNPNDGQRFQQQPYPVRVAFFSYDDPAALAGRPPQPAERIKLRRHDRSMLQAVALGSDSIRIEKRFS
uniref:Uncharacterized protein n=1 Tax=Oryza sativa subsp. japonica TaxID=39947 RepID=Q67UL0_ORYSJ|nr:hypothetical protein [Oryza sativa Japonica Group]